MMEDVIMKKCFTTVEEMAPDDVAIITQIGFNEWYASATEKEKKKILKGLGCVIRWAGGFHRYGMIEAV